MFAVATRHYNLSGHVWFWQGSFVAAFASSNLGDVSPNTKGPFCVNTGDSCDNPQSSCPVGGVSSTSPALRRRLARGQLGVEQQIQTRVVEHCA